jgi:FtsH-binding integral membrane protein
MGEMALLATVAVLAGTVMAAAWHYPRASVAYPFAVGAVLLALAVLRFLALMAEKEPAVETANADEADDAPREDLPPKSMATYAAIVVAMVAALNVIWFPVAAFIAGTLVLRLVFGNRWTAALVSAFLVSAASSGVFWALGVPLPGPGL